MTASIALQVILLCALTIGVILWVASPTGAAVGLRGRVQHRTLPLARAGAAMNRATVADTATGVALGLAIGATLLAAIARWAWGRWGV